MNENPYRSPDPTADPRRTRVKIKVYGLIPMTRRGYLVTQLVMAAAAILIVALVYVLVPPEARQSNWVLKNLAWLLAAGLVLEVCETAVMLRKFRAKASGLPRAN